jgi:predicted O-methyltransferase YrrM
MAVIGDEKLQSFLDGLHAKSREQTALIQAFEARRNDAELPPGADEIKAEFCYQLCRAKKASKVIEVGTSYGVSTIYLAAAVRENARSYGVDGIVIGTEYEPKKAEAARANFAAAGVSQFIELREGDLRETLKRIDGPVDFVLMDVWIAMARSAIELIAPHLSEGAIVVCDNTLDHRAFYADYFAFLNDPANRFTTMTLPFQGGLELSVRR